jgi:DNA repair exonuclease SbcCD ATPase subunit
MSSPGPVGPLLSSEPLEKYRREAEERERVWAQAREKREREERRELRAAVSNEKWPELEQRLAALERAHQTTRESVLDVAQAAEAAIDNLWDQPAALPRETKEEIRELKIEVAKLTAQVSELREHKANFQFARERDSGEQNSDLPKFLPRRDLN